MANFVHNQLLSPLLNILHHSPSPDSLLWMPCNPQITTACSQEKKADLIQSTQEIRRKNLINTVVKKRWQTSFTTNYYRLYSTYSTNAFAFCIHILPPTRTPNESSNHNSMFTPRPVILKYTYRLTFLRSGDFGDVPRTDITVEGVSLLKHCHKKRRQVTLTVNAIKKGGRKNPDKLMGQEKVDMKYCGEKRWQTSFTTNYHRPFSTYAIVPSPDCIPWMPLQSSPPTRTILKNKYRLTNSHVGDSGNVPLIEISVEGAIFLKHCRKKRRQISFTVNARKESRRTLIKYCGKKRWQIFIHNQLLSPFLNIFDRRLLPAFSDKMHLHHILATNPSHEWALQSQHSQIFWKRINLLPFISVTLETSHWLRSWLKLEVSIIAVARKKGRFYSHSTQ